MSYPGLITCGKALLEAYIKGDDLETISNKIFFQASTKFGLDSPVACVTKRISWYGNTDDI